MGFEVLTFSGFYTQLFKIAFITAMIIAHFIIIFASWKVLISSFFETHFKIKTSDNNLDTTAKVSGYVRSKQTCDDKKAPVRVILKTRDQRILCEDNLENLISRKIWKDIHPVYKTRKIGPNIRPKESKPPIVNQQCVVYHFKCDLCDVDYVSYTCRHLYQRIEEHKGSAIGKHVRDHHGRDPSDISLRFKILRKCQSKLDCLVYEMLKEVKPTLNTQSDSIPAKLFL